MTTKVKSDFDSKKIILIGIFVLLVFIGYQLYKRNLPPQTEMDCLNLGSNERTKLCLEMMKKEKILEDFPVNSLIVENVKGENDGYCIKLSGTIYNSSSYPATTIMLRTNFSKVMNGDAFHYEVFSPFQNIQEQIQPNSRKSFSQCMNLQTYNVVSNVKNWYFSILPNSGKIFSQ